MNLTRWKSPNESGPEVTEFKYGPLKSWKTGIRLAQLLPGSGNQGISIHLIDSFVSGSGRVSYDALSYTWGDGGQTKNILCNGKRLSVTQTLLDALHRFRDHDEVVTLWADQICICQQRIPERNQQVQLMNEIFKGARKVIVWLGEDYDDSRAGMQLAKQLLSISHHKQQYGLDPSGFEANGLPRRGHKRWSALAAILRRPWFWRTWVVQEVVLNPVVDLVLGSAVLTWTELESIIRLLEETPAPMTWDFSHAIDVSELPFSRINRIRLRHQGIIATPVTPQWRGPDWDTKRRELSVEEASALGGDRGDDPELLELLMMSRGLGATDPRDKIYALLGLSNHDIVPDYSMSPESVFNAFAQQTVGTVTSMVSRRKAANITMSSYDREVRRAMMLISCAGRHNQSLKLQSWVPDWTINLRSLPLMTGLEERFAAGGDKVGVFDWQPESGLELCGKLLDVVTAAGVVHLEYDRDNEAAAANGDISRWMQEARQISASRVTRSLGKVGNIDAFHSLRKTLSLCKHGYYIEGSQRRRNSILDDPDTFDETIHNTSYTLTVGPTRGRVMFTTSRGYLGLGPWGITEGDQVYVIMGADVPWILRNYEDGLELIGEAYVQGAMHGEVLQMEDIAVVDVKIL